jgi:hypothetical protein
MRDKLAKCSDSFSRLTWRQHGLLLFFCVIACCFILLLLKTRVFEPALKADRRAILEAQNQLRFLEDQMNRLRNLPPLPEIQAQKERMVARLAALPVRTDETKQPSPLRRDDATGLSGLQMRVSDLATRRDLSVLRHASLAQGNLAEDAERIHREIELRGLYNDIHGWLLDLDAQSRLFLIVEMEVYTCPDLPGHVRLRLHYAL